jgi:hypothetical protein
MRYCMNSLSLDLVERDADADAGDTADAGGASATTS